MIGRWLKRGRVWAAAVAALAVLAAVVVAAALGAGDGGQPQGTVDVAEAPIVAPSSAYKAIAAGAVHSCALRTDSTITCWGDNYWGQADAPEGTYWALTVGLNSSCALRTDGTVTCWGQDPVRLV